jgi:hypothetical protein
MVYTITMAGSWRGSHAMDEAVSGDDDDDDEDGERERRAGLAGNP